MRHKRAVSNPKDSAGALTTGNAKDVEIEFCPDGWERFEKAVDAAVRRGPQRKVKTGHGPNILKPRSR